MRKLTRVLIYTAFLASFLGSNVGDLDAAVCQQKTLVVYGNGILNEQFEAEFSLKALRREIQGFPLANSYFPLEYTLAYANENQVNNDGTVSESLLQRLKYTYQVELQLQTNTEEASMLWRMIAGDVAIPAIRDEMLRAAAETNLLGYVTDIDLATQLNEIYRPALDAGKRVLTVAHSQGNFYANAAYDQLLLDGRVGPTTNHMGIVAVASVASFVNGNQGNDHYVTAWEDLAVALRNQWYPGQALSPNTSNFGDINTDDPIGHNFVKYYLAGGNTSAAILNHIVLVIDVLQYPSCNLIITTVAGNGQFPYTGDNVPAIESGIDPDGLFISSDGLLYIADYGHNRIRMVDQNGIITTVAGNGVNWWLYPPLGDGGQATSASVIAPTSVKVRPDGSMFIADYGNDLIRKVDPSGIITTVAGQPASGFFGDGGPATQAYLNGPVDVAIASDESLYIADLFNARIRKVGPNGIITTIAGIGNPLPGENPPLGDGGPALQAFMDPYAIDIGPDGSIYIADSGTRIRKIDVNGIISTVAGNGQWGYSGDEGPATQASLNAAFVIDVDSDGSIYIADSANCRIRQVDPNGIIHAVVGNGQCVSSGDGGPLALATLDRPVAVAVAGDGSLYIAESGGLVRKVSHAP